MIAAGAGACTTPDGYTLLSSASEAGGRLAAVRLEACAGSAWCQALHVGPAGGSLAAVATLARDERVTEIIWSPDGRRVGFLVDGQELRLYDAQTRAPAGQVDLVPDDARPTTRVARGVTFSDTGAALTFDDCPRRTSGCRPGLIAIR